MVIHDDHDDFGGLHRDLKSTGAAMDRRNLFRMAARLGGAIGALQLLGCGGSSTSPTASTAATTTTTTPTTNAACSVIPNETEGPFPGDGSNGPNVLTLSGVVRSDIRSSFAGLSGTADGVPLTIALTIVSTSTLCAARRPRRLCVALRPAGTLFALHLGRDQPELSARRPGDRRERHGHVHVDLSRLLLRAAGRTSISRSIPASPLR